MKKFSSLVFLLTVFLFAHDVPAGTLVQFRTILGEIDVELYDQDKPVTVQNFLRYVKAGLYTNDFFHRCIPGFVIQGGGFSENSKTDTNLFGSFNPIATFPPITNEFKVGPFHSNAYGTIAMAKTSDPNSATSQFFFNLVNNAGSLDDTNNSGGFTVFGHVVTGTNTSSGTNILNFFNTLFKPGGAIVDIRSFYGNNTNTALFSDLPVTYYGNVAPRYADLLYVDISLVNVQIKSLTNRLQQISWNSVASVTNLVEFTTNFPPQWTLLARTNGTGATMSVVDSATNATRRFYRVRVLY